MKNVTMSVSSYINSMPPQIPSSLNTTKSLTSVTFSAQFDDDCEARKFAIKMLNTINKYGGE